MAGTLLRNRNPITHARNAPSSASLPQIRPSNEHIHYRKLPGDRDESLGLCCITNRLVPFFSISISPAPPRGYVYRFQYIYIYIYLPLFIVTSRFSLVFKKKRAVFAWMKEVGLGLVELRRVY